MALVMTMVIAMAMVMVRVRVVMAMPMVMVFGQPYWWIGAQCADGITCTAADRWLLVIIGDYW